jgi:hypothetical protein
MNKLRIINSPHHVHSQVKALAVVWKSHSMRRGNLGTAGGDDDRARYGGR